MSLHKQRLLLFFVPIILALPFLNRAYFVDDHFFVQIARWIKDNPTRPYDFPDENSATDFSLSKPDLSMRIVNPLLHHYYMAAIMKVGGEREWLLRLGCLLLSCCSALVLFALARRWVQHAFLATLLILVTPVHWLTSYSLLIDPTMALFFLMALYTFVRASESNALLWLVASGLFTGLAAVSKYTAVLVLPVTWVWLGLHWRGIQRKFLFAIPTLIGVGILALYVHATKNLYGVGHLFGASHETLHGVTVGKLLVLAVFLSGSTIVPLLVWASVEKPVASFAALLVLAVVGFFASSLGGFHHIQAVLMGIWTVTSGLLIVSFVRNVLPQKKPTDLFLFLWLLGFLVMMSVVMQWVAARYLMIGLPPLVFCVVRLIETTRASRVREFLMGGIAFTAIVALSLAIADDRQAETARSIVKELRAQNLLENPRNHYFAEAYTMTYLAKEGWKPVSNVHQLRPGDRILTTEVSLPLFWFFRERVPMRLIGTVQMPSRFPVRVMDSQSAAGFYASAWGPLPFSFSKGPWEQFDLFEIIPAP